MSCTYLKLKCPIGVCSLPKVTSQDGRTGECESSQDKKMQGTCTEGPVCTNDVTPSENAKVIDIRTKVSVRMSDVTTSNIDQDKDSSHVPLESNQHGKTLSYQA